MKWFIRSSITFLWLAVLVLTLYAPKWSAFLPEENVLSVFTWGELIDTDVVQDFEHKTGIKVHLSYYSSNEELIAKLRATRGKGYDLVLPSDYAVRTLIQEGLLKEIDHTQVQSLSRLDPALLNHPFDPGNRFSLPFAWELYGFGVHEEMLHEEAFTPSWDALFTARTPITMTNDPLEAINIAAYYLFGKVDGLTPEQAMQVKALLNKQKAWTVAYNSFRPDLLLTSNNSPLVLSASSFMQRAMRQTPGLAFVLPKEGTFTSIENLCIPATTQKDALVYQFIDALYAPSSVATHWNHYMLFPATADALEIIQCDPKTRALLTSAKEGSNTWQFYRNLLPEQQQRRLWIEAKAE